MKITKFEDLIAWQKAMDLCELIYRHGIQMNDYTFRNQFQHAALSISNNIAEGFNRHTNPDFRRFLFYAKGSCSEVKSMAYLAERIQYLNAKGSHQILDRCDELILIIKGLIRRIS